MQGVPKHIIECQVAQFAKCDPEFGAGVAKRMGVNVLKLSEAAD